MYGRVALRVFIHPGLTANYKPKATKGRNTNRSRLAKKQKRPLPLHHTITSSAIYPQTAGDPSFLKTQTPSTVLENSLAVDAACSGNPGAMEYRGVHVASRQQVFHFGPMYGTNNIGEFLAIVHGLALLKQKGFDMPIYSDSVNAISWVKQKKCKTKLPRDPKTEQLFQLIERAEKWLRENIYSTPILKWETQQWGEIPADFGRK